MTKRLLVEDDNNLREIYEARLQAEGYTIVSAHDGEEALVVAKAEKPDLIISDVMMPKISGFEMLDILRNTDGLQDVKVIMLTALGQADDQQRADKLGADRYLVKSQVTLEDIVKVAHELLGDNAGASPEPVADVAATTPPETPTAPDAPAATTAAAPSEAPLATEPLPAESASAQPAVEPPMAEPPAATPEAPTEPNTSPAAESSANEEATVEAQIEDFVAGASSSTTAPTSTTTDPVTAAPSTTDTMSSPPPAEPSAMATSAGPVSTDNTTSNPASTETPTSIEVADEKLVSDAADTLEASTKAAGETAEAATDDKDSPENQPQQKKVGGERVIEPITGEPKKDINALLAIEEAKEAQAQPAAPVIPVIVDNQKGPETQAAPPTTTVNPTDQVDPSNIAL